MLMPLMHSKSQVIHEQAIPLFQRYTDRHALDFEVIIDRFGRYPHRNALLGHESTEEEVEFLKQEDFVILIWVLKFEGHLKRA